MKSIQRVVAICGGLGLAIAGGFFGWNGEGDASLLGGLAACGAGLILIGWAVRDWYVEPQRLREQARQTGVPSSDSLLLRVTARQPEAIRPLVLRLYGKIGIPAVAVYSLFLAPMTYYFLRGHVGNGVAWTIAIGLTVGSFGAIAFFLFRDVCGKLSESHITLTDSGFTVSGLHNGTNYGEFTFEYGQVRAMVLALPNASLPRLRTKFEDEELRPTAGMDTLRPGSLAIVDQDHRKTVFHSAVIAFTERSFVEAFAGLADRQVRIEVRSTS